MPSVTQLHELKARANPSLSLHTRDCAVLVQQHVDANLGMQAWALGAPSWGRADICRSRSLRLSWWQLSLWRALSYLEGSLDTTRQVKCL